MPRDSRPHTGPRLTGRQGVREPFDPLADEPSAATEPDGSTYPPQTPDAVDELIGQVVANRYRVLQRMGEGGMGTVYLVEHIAIEKKLALKVLLLEYARKQDLKDRFLQEAKAAARIGHENIVDIIDFGHTPNGSVFFAMEYLEGEDLARVIRAGALPWSRAKPILLQICRAMGAAHSKGIIHRDMKPENIYLVEREGRRDFVKVLDFGIAKVSTLGESERRLTRTGMIFGTPEYMSPEQAQGHRPDHRVDIYALGVIMYEMLTGQVPFKADTFMGILTKHIFEAPAPPSQLREDIPAEVEEIVLHAMAKDREARFRSMTELAAAIAQASGRMTRPTGDQPSVLRTMTPAPRRLTGGAADALAADAGDSVPSIPTRRTLPLVIGALLALLLGGGVTAAAVLLTDRGEQQPADAAAVVSPALAPRPDAAAAAPRPDASAARPTATHIRLRVLSTPAGAAISVGGRELGATNTTIRLSRGDKPQRLELQLEGYKPWSTDVLPDRDDEVSAVLEKARRGRPRPTKGPRAKTQPPTPPTKGFGRTPDLLDPFAR